MRPVGEYQLSGTRFWVLARTIYETQGSYTPDMIAETREFKHHWKQEGIKSRRGVIIDGRYLPGYFYFYLNYCHIYDKVKESSAFPEIWDSDYHFFLYIQLCILKGKFALIAKKRQWGLSYKMCSILINNYFLGLELTHKIISPEDTVLEDTWAFLEKYYNFLSEHSGWSERYTQGGKGRWVEETEATLGTKTVKSGRKNAIKTVNTRQSASKGVGGPLVIGWFEEGGKNPTVHKTLQFIRPNVTKDGVVTGLLVVAGSVGELKESESYKGLVYNPVQNGFLTFIDPNDPTKNSTFFIPVFFNYIHNIVDENGVSLGTVKCYDEDGNSDIQLAKKYLYETRLIEQQKDPESYALYCSQYPFTVDEMFGAREQNIFPTNIISPHSLYLEGNYSPMTVELLRDENQKLYHKLISKAIVTDFPLKATSYREGAICMEKPPMENAPLGLYIAGVDTTSKVNVNKYQESVMSIYIYKLAHFDKGVLIPGEIVCWYAGRYDNPEDTFQLVLDLMDYYNVLAAVENDNKSFVDWVQERGKQYRLMKRSDIPILKELVPNSSIIEEYGLRMGSGSKDLVRKACYEKIIDYMEERIGEENDKIIYGVYRIKDKMVLKEALVWKEGGNYDRLTALGITLLVGKMYEERHIFKNLNKQKDNNTVPLKINSLVSLYHPKKSYRKQINQLKSKF